MAAGAQIHGSDLVRGAMRDTAGSGWVLGEAFSRGRRGRVRLAEGQVRALLADRAGANRGADQAPEGVSGDAHDEKARYWGVGAGGGGVRTRLLKLLPPAIHRASPHCGNGCTFA